MVNGVKPEDDAVRVPPLSLREAEQVVRRLAPALRAHARWVQRIHTMLICRTPPADADLADDSHLLTDLGRWLVEEQSEYIRRQPAYQAAVERYRVTHEHARVLCRAVAAGTLIATGDYLSFARALARFEQSIEALLRELWDFLRDLDPLTGIATRHGMMRQMARERDRVRRTGGVCTVAMVDIDHFKRINDLYGHAAGDAVLEAVSAFFVQNLRHYDQVCRYGGEEFVLMLPDTEPDQAAPIIDRLRRGLADLPIVLEDGTTLHVTASFGLSRLAPNQALRATIAQADQAMYVAKRAGRNCLRLWGDDRTEDIRSDYVPGAAVSRLSARG